MAASDSGSDGGGNGAIDRTAFLAGLSVLHERWPALLDRRTVEEIALKLQASLGIDYLGIAWLTPDGEAMRSYALWHSERCSTSSFPFGARVPCPRERLLRGFEGRRQNIERDLRKVADLTEGKGLLLSGLKAMVSTALGDPICGVMAVGYSDGERLVDDHLPALHEVAKLLAHGFDRALLLARAQQLETFVHAAPDGVLIVSNEGTISYVNPAAEVLLRAPAHTLIGSDAGLAIRLDKPLRECAGAGPVLGDVLAGSERVPVEIVVSSATLDDAIDPGALHLHLRDLRDVRRVEEGLRLRNQQLRVLTEVARTAATAPNFAVAAERALGPLTRLGTATCVLVMRVDSGTLSAVASEGTHCEPLLEALTRALPSLGVTEELRRAPLVDDIESLTAPLVVDGAVRGLLAWALEPSRSVDEHDSELFRACADALAGSLAATLRQEALSSALKRHITLLDGLPVSVVVIDVEGRITWSNRVIERIVGYSRDEVMTDMAIIASTRMGPPPLEVFADDIRRFLTDGTPVPWRDQPRRHRDGHVLTLWQTVYPLLRSNTRIVEGYMVVSQDVTAMRDTERHVVAQDRLAAIGLLAAGIGHEINNPAAYVALGVQQVERTLDAAVEESRRGIDVSPRLERMRSTLIDISEGVHRIAGITRELRLFARAPDSPVLGNFDVNDTLRSAARLVDTELRARARLDLHLGEVPELPGPFGRLSQVFLNLLINAQQAIPAGAPDRNAVTVTSAVVAGSVEVVVKDSGAGIAPDVLPHIFDPFFTTKPAGEGTGLGLAISYDLVRQLGGTLTVDSTVGRGSTFTVRVPLVGGPAASARPVL